MPEPPVSLRAFPDPDALPQDAQALLGQDAFSTLGWYRATLAAGLPDGAQPAFQIAEADGGTLAVFPMLRLGSTFGALSTPYTCLWRPLLAPGLSPAQLQAIGHAAGRAWRRSGVVRLDALPAGGDGLDALLAGLRRAGLRTLAFDHFGNWHEDVAGQGWESYLAGRPRRLRTAIQRQTKRMLAQPGYRFTLVQSEDGLADAVAAYETVYAASWKQPEPQPAFNAALMRACAQDGTLRLGILGLGGESVAAQLWVVHKGWGGVLKLAYSEAHKALAPGNVLTGLMIRHLLDVDRVAEIDFGRGDDEYKQQWALQRRQRVGVLLASPMTAAGILQIGRHLAGKVRKKGLLF